MTSCLPCCPPVMGNSGSSQADDGGPELDPAFPRGWFTFLDGRKENENLSENRWADPVLTFPEGDFHRGGQQKGAFYFKPETVSAEPKSGSRSVRSEDQRRASGAESATALHSKPVVVMAGAKNENRDAKRFFLRKGGVQKR